MAEDAEPHGAGAADGSAEADGDGPAPDRQADPRPDRPAPPGGARWILAAVLMALFAAMGAARILSAGELEQTALFYVGLPAFIALVVALTARPKTATGTAVASVSVALALAGPLLGEGMVCLLMAAPLFLLVAVVIGRSADAARRRRNRAHAAVVLPLVAVLALALEGSGTWEMSRAEAVSATRTVQATPEQVERALAGEPAFDDPAPVFLRRVPFPRPLHATGTGLAPGDTRTIEFTPRRTLAVNAQPTPRAMGLTVTRSGKGHVVFDVTEDTTLARWLDLRSAEVSWRGVDGGRSTELTWRLHYHRTYDPGWYFGPLQRYGMTQAAGYLADTFTTTAETAAAPGSGPGAAARPAGHPR